MKLPHAGTYFDLDGVSFKITSELLRNNMDYLKKMAVNVQKTKVSHGNMLVNVTSCEHSSVHLQEICTYIGRFNLYVVFKGGTSKREYFYNEIMKRSDEFNEHSYSDSQLQEVINVPVPALADIMDKSGCFIYGEKYGNKYRFNSVNEILKILNNDIRILSLPFCKMKDLELDFCMNVSVGNELAMLRLKENMLEELGAKRVYVYNVLNSKKYNDYHANKILIDTKLNYVNIIKINMYNPIMRNICKKLYGRKELYNKKFLHEALYSAHNINYVGVFKYCNTYQKKNIKDLYENIKRYKNIKNYYRCEFKYQLDNAKNKYKEYKRKDIKEMFRIFSYFKTSYFKNRSVRNYINRFLCNVKYVYKVFREPSRTYIDLAKKIFINTVLFEIIVRGGREKHMLEYNIKQLNYGLTLPGIMNLYADKFNSFDYCISLVATYVNKSNIKQIYRSDFNRIYEIFKRINNKDYEICIMKEFISMSDNNSSSSNESIISAEEFETSYIKKAVRHSKKLVNLSFYKNLIYALRILSLEKFSLRPYFRYIDKNDFIFKNIKVTRDNMPGVDDFKKELIKNVSNAIKYGEIMRTRNEKFHLTKNVKLLFAHYVNNYEYSNKQFMNDTSTPFWLFLIKQTRIKNLRDSLTSVKGNDIPDYVLDPENSIIEFIDKNLVFKKSIKENVEFCSLIKYMVRMNDTEYILTMKDYNKYKLISQNLSFIKENEPKAKRKKISGKLEDIAVYNSIFNLVNILKLSKISINKFSIGDIKKYLLLMMNNSDNFFLKENIDNYITDIIKEKFFSQYFEVFIDVNNKTYFLPKWK